MYKQTRALFIVLSWFLLIAAAGCAKKTPKVFQPPAPLQHPMEYLDAPSNVNFQRAYSKYQAGDQEGARADFEAILRVSPEYYPALLGLSYSYLAEGNTEQATAFAEQAIVISPGYPQAHFLLARLKEEQNLYDEALQHLDQVAGTAPDYPEAAQYRNILRLKATERHIQDARKAARENPEEALRHFEIARKLAPEIADTSLEIAQIYFAQGDCSRALENISGQEEGLDIRPELKKRAAYCLIETGDLDRALNMMREVALVEPDDVELKQKIAETEEDISARKLPPEYQLISSAEKVTRGQVAALIGVNLKFLKNIRPSSSQIVTDTLNHWAHQYIRKVVDLGMIDIFPNRTFRPDQSITRLELARAATRFLEILESAEKIQPPDISTIEIPDVARKSLYYPMISKSIASRVMSLDADGNFHLYRTVTGAEALSVVKRLRSLSE